MFDLKYNIKVQLLIISVVVLFKVQLYSQCGYSSLIIHFPDTANGITINESNTEPTQYASAPNDTMTICGVLSGTFWIGYSGVFTQTLAFSSPVNNVVYIVTGSDSVSGGAVESFSFAVNTGTLSCSQANNSSSSYLYTQQGNLFTANSSPPDNGHSNGAYITLSSTISYDTVKIYGTGHNGGSIMSLCASSINTTAINNTAGKQQIVNLYPNPNNGSFTISYSGRGKQLTVEVYNLMGQRTLSQQYNMTNTTNIPVTGLSEGVYFIKVNVDNVPVKTEKIIVTK